MRKVSATGVVQGQKFLIVCQLTDTVPVFTGQIGGVLDPHLLKCRCLYLMVQDRPVGAEVCIRSAVGLYVGVFGTEEAAGGFTGFRFDFVDIFASGIETVERVPFAVLVREQRAHSGLYGQGRIVFAGDELQTAPLGLQLLDHRLCRQRRDFVHE